MTILLDAEGATATLYRDAPEWNGLACCALGNLDIPNAAAGHALVRQALTVAAKEGVQAILGPMDGDTWHPYRAVTQSDGRPPFLMEPVSGPHDVTCLEAAGFEPVSRYVSAVANLPDTIGDAPIAVPGIEIEPWDGADAEQLIGDLYTMSLAAFSKNRFFKPIAPEAFEAIYRPLLPFIVPDHVLFARRGSDLVGFLFGSPNPLWSDGPRSCILKTYATAERGVGHCLADTYHRRAMALGFEQVIHALMHEDNISRDRSARHQATVFRQYALMGRRLP